jgi:hypothetical protein
VGCFGLTEPNHGSDPAHMETKVSVRTGTIRRESRQEKAAKEFTRHHETKPNWL